MLVSADIYLGVLLRRGSGFVEKKVGGAVRERKRVTMGGKERCERGLERRRGARSPSGGDGGRNPRSKQITLEEGKKKRKDKT